MKKTEELDKQIEELKRLRVSAGSDQLRETIESQLADLEKSRAAHEVATLKRLVDIAHAEVSRPPFSLSSSF